MYTRAGVERARWTDAGSGRSSHRAPGGVRRDPLVRHRVLSRNEADREQPADPAPPPLFPNARFVVLVRDGRAVADSLSRVDWWDRQLRVVVRRTPGLGGPKGRIRGRCAPGTGSRSSQRSTKVSAAVPDDACDPAPVRGSRRGAVERFPARRRVSSVCPTTSPGGRRSPVSRSPTRTTGGGRGSSHRWRAHHRDPTVRTGQARLCVLRRRRSSSCSAPVDAAPACSTRSWLSTRMSGSSRTSTTVCRSHPPWVGGTARSIVGCRCS